MRMRSHWLERRRPSRSGRPMRTNRSKRRSAGISQCHRRVARQRDGARTFSRSLARSSGKISHGDRGGKILARDGDKSVIVLVHPTGNANVRAVLDALDEAGLLERFITTSAFSRRSHPLLSERIRGRLRRNYSLPDEKIDIHPLHESIRLMAGAVGLSCLTKHETGWASLDAVFHSLDREAARRLRKHCYGESL